MAPSDLSARIRSEVERGRPREEIVAGLLERGLSQASAERFVDRAIAARDAAPPAPPGRAPSVAADEDDTDAADDGPAPFPWKAVVIAALVAVVGLVGYAQWRKPSPRAVVGEAAGTVHEAPAPEDQARPKALVSPARVADEARFRGDAPRLNSFLMLLRNPDIAWSDVCEASLELGRSGVREAIPDLQARLADSTRRSLQGCAATALIALGEVDEPLAFYLASVQGSDDELKRIGIAGLGQIGPRAVAAGLPHLEMALKSPDATNRYLAVDALSKMGPEGVPLLRTALNDSDSMVQNRAATALAAMGQR